MGAKSEIYKLLNDLAAEGKTIIMISSELPEILRMSHFIIVMREGQITGRAARGLPYSRILGHPGSYQIQPVYQVEVL